MNAQVPYFWSEADSCLRHEWAGRHVWCNPPFKNAKQILIHFLNEWATDPENTSAVFILPKRTWASWYHLKVHFEVLHEYPVGSDLFTTPNWERLHHSSDTSHVRKGRGPTTWPVMVLYKAPSKRAWV